MKNCLLLILMLITFKCFSQNIRGNVVDSATGRPLPYAAILYNNNKNFLYTDSAGSFVLNADSLKKTDTLFIEFLGYKPLYVSASSLHANEVIKMVQQASELNPVIVSNCRRMKTYTLNNRTRGIRNYLGPGPETKIIIVGHYLNKKQKAGYIKKISFYDETYSGKVVVPVRLRWYDWNEVTQSPGKELTSTNIIIYPYKKGWNDFTMPANTAYFPVSGIVFGFEFIYPVEFVEQYRMIASTSEKLSWLSNMTHRWSLGMQTSRDEEQNGFFSINNHAFERYNERSDRFYMKPAIKFEISHCEQ